MNGRLFAILLLMLAFLSSCEKKEKALVLPPPGSASHAGVEMGADYDKQVFFDLETNAVVYTSSPASWDLSFESGPNGKHVFVNGGNKTFVFNTHKTDIRSVTTLPGNLVGSGAGWQFDASCGLPDSTAIGNWFYENGNTKGELYVVQTGSGTLYKTRMLASDNSGYSIEWLPLADTSATTNKVQIGKDSIYNFTYFSFKGGIVKPEPPKNTWDIVFTRYVYVYRNYPTPGKDFPYDVTGVLLNPYNTSASADSSLAFSNINLQVAESLPANNYRDVIGFDWKVYNFNTSRYEVNRSKNYIIHTRKNQIYKLRFLEFYNNAGVKGNPAFEFERLK